jgi:hypothetical protein
MLWIPILLFALIVAARKYYVQRTVDNHTENLAKIIPKPYFPTTGSVWSLKRHQYDYPDGVEVLKNPTIR